MVRTMAAALAAGNKITRGYSGMCLLFVQTCYGARAVYGSAIAAWNASKHKHRTSSTRGIPVGAPLFFSPHGSPWGHVALYAGGGRMRTTNSATGRVQTDYVSTWTRVYGYHLLGWTSDIEGQTIPTTTTTKKKKNTMTTQKDIWNYGIGHDGKAGYKNMAAWAHLSLTHMDTAFIRRQNVQTLAKLDAQAKQINVLTTQLSTLTKTLDSLKGSIKLVTINCQNATTSEK